MKKTFKFFAAALAIVAAASCSKEISNENTQATEQELVHKVFTASLNVDPDSETKTTLHEDGVTVHWAADDVIKVLPAGSATGTDFSVVSYNGPFADFVGETIDANAYKAIYPAAALLTNGNIDWWETKSDYFVIGSKSTKSALGHQYAVENDFSIIEEFGASSNFALSTTSENGHLYFKNINAYLKVKLAMADAASIEVSAARVMSQPANGNQDLSEYAKLGGPIIYDLARDLKGVLASAGGDIMFKKQDGTLLLSGDDIYYYIAVPAVKIENLKLVVKDASGKVLQTLTKSGEFTFKANTIYNLGTIDSAPAPDPVKVGDYIYSDGTYSTSLDSSKEVVGIVFFAGNPKDEFNDTELPSEYCNGLAIGTKTYTTVWSDSELSSVISELDLPTTYQPSYSIGGYSVKKIWERNGIRLAVYNNSSSGNIPENTSGWYLPVINEWGHIFANLNDLNSKLKAANVDEINIGSNANVGSFWLPLTYGSSTVKIYTDYYKKELKYKTDWQYTSTSMARPIFAF